MSTKESFILFHNENFEIKNDINEKNEKILDNFFKLTNNDINLEIIKNMENVLQSIDIQQFIERDGINKLYKFLEIEHNKNNEENEYHLLNCLF
jgi:hypothetical protein